MQGWRKYTVEKGEERRGEERRRRGGEGERGGVEWGR
jgi:hypothetical protein